MRRDSTRLILFHPKFISNNNRCSQIDVYKFVAKQMVLLVDYFSFFVS